MTLYQFFMLNSLIGPTVEAGSWEGGYQSHDDHHVGGMITPRRQAQVAGVGGSAGVCNQVSQIVGASIKDWSRFFLLTSLAPYAYLYGMSRALPGHSLSYCRR